MTDLLKKEFENYFKMYIYTFFLSIIAFGFALSNYTLSVDNEIPIISNFALDTGRWGQNLIRYHIFKGHLPYFTLLLSLLSFSLAAVRLTKLFNFKGISAYIFCGLFITFPQLAYEVVFNMMADIAGLGILFSVFSIELFIKGFDSNLVAKKIFFFSLGVLLTAFTLSTYQAFILVIPTICIVLFFKSTFEALFNLKHEIKRLMFHSVLVILSSAVYYLSVKIICPPIEDSGYLSSFLSGEGNNPFLDFFSIWFKNLTGSFFYGERSFIITLILSFFLSVRFFIDKKNAFIRFISLFLILLLPFIMSFAITNGYHPPRLYVTSNMVFAFVVVFSLDYFKITLLTITKTAVALIIVTNIYFITTLFLTSNKIYQHDRRIAEKIDNIIQTKYPDFFTTEKNIYFYGFFPYEYHQKFRLKNSEVFGGSIFNWGNSADNYRLVSFFKDAHIAEYKMLDTQEKLNLVKDSIAGMPAWPDSESIKMFNGIVVVKLGNEKGTKLYFEQ
jgi:hypothetical protein